MRNVGTEIIHIDCVGKDAARGHYIMWLAELGETEVRAAVLVNPEFADGETIAAAIRAADGDARKIIPCQRRVKTKILGAGWRGDSHRIGTCAVICGRRKVKVA